MTYDPARIERLYDEMGMAEWERFDRSPLEEIKLCIHQHYLQKYIPPHSRVLEIGAGPGRFTEKLHELGCRIVVADISNIQLELNKKRGQETGFWNSVEQWVKADICHLPGIGAASFDVVVAYGGPLSYVLEKRDAAVQECARVLKPGGIFVSSVMSLWGSMHRALKTVLDIPYKNNQAIIQTGDLTEENEINHKHTCHMFRAHEFGRLLENNGFAVVQMAASNSVSTNKDELLAEIRRNNQKWQELLAFELEASAEPGFLDGGTHIIAVAKKI